MFCPYCQQSETKVIDSRATQDFRIRRRRECLSSDCQRRFTTYEVIEQASVSVVKKDGSRTPFDREKLRSGIEKACWKRPVSALEIDTVVTDIETDLQENFDREVNSQYIGERVISALRVIDQVAFVRFASVYREFQDVNDFVEELSPMLKAGVPK